MRRAAPACLVLLLALGCSADPDDRLEAAASTTDPAALREVDWGVDDLLLDGERVDLRGVAGTFRVSADDEVSAQGCNGAGGRATVGAGTIRAQESVTTLMACDGARADLDKAFARVLAGGRWSIDEGVLTLTADGVRMGLRERATPFTSRGDVLDEGAFGDAVYRLSFERGQASVGVTWESRDQKGTGLGSSGIGRATDEAITYLDPNGAAVAGRGYVYVPAPLSVATVVWQRADGGRAELERHELEGVTTWALHAGFVGGPTKGGVAIGLDASGREVMRSRVLPY